MWCNGSTLALGAWRAVQIGHLRPIKKYIKRKGIIMTTTKAWSNFKKSDVEGNLTPVLNVIGTPTKDLTPFIEMQNN